MMLADCTNSPLKTKTSKPSFQNTTVAATNTALQWSNIKRVKELLGEFLAGRPEGYMVGVSETITGSVLGGLIPGADSIANKSDFMELNAKMGDYLEMKKFEPRNWRAVGDEVFFNVDWEFVWKQGDKAGTTVETTALVRKVLKDGMICQKYHMICPSVIEALTGVKPPEDSSVERVKALVAEYMAGRPEGYMLGVSDTVKASMLGGLIPGAESVTSKSEFQGIMDVIGDWMTVSKFEPCNYRALPDASVIFNVNWEFVWKPTGRTVQTTAIVRKVLRDNQICEKYHLCDCDEVLKMPTIEAEIQSWVAAMVAEGETAFKAKDLEALSTFWDKHYLDTAVLIRPSGNPLTKAAYLAMMGSEDVVMESSTLLKVEDIKEIAGGRAAVFTYTSHDKFRYKGTPNDDIAKFSAVVEKGPEGWKMAHVHRGTGQKPQ